MAVDIQEQFDGLPKEIRTWLSSDRATQLVRGISSSLNLTKEESRRIVPRAILRLVTGDLAPQDFIDDVSIDFDISRSSARIIAEEIDKRILKPIDKQLLIDAGIDTKLIFLQTEDFFSQPKSAIAAEIAAGEEALPAGRQGLSPTGPKVISEGARGERSVIRGEGREVSDQGRGIGDTAPVILRTEDEVKPIAELRSVHLERPAGFSEAPAVTPAPVAQVHIGETKKGAGARGEGRETRVGEQQRVVHYSGYRTMLAPSKPVVSDQGRGVSDGVPKMESRINLRTFSPIAPAAPEEPERPRFPEPRRESGIKNQESGATAGPKVEGNIVDLR
ncbi:MAG: hypothetical protein HYS43_01935 [Candidatus Liptonbacteria bacterium]|nr:hypothetical protein [Candidatus Liptonbacteria bacterium]